MNIKMHNLIVTNKEGTVLIDILGLSRKEIRLRMKAMEIDYGQAGRIVFMSASAEFYLRLLAEQKNMDTGCFLVTASESGKKYYAAFSEAFKTVTDADEDTESIQLYFVTLRDDGHREYTELYSRTLLKNCEL